MCHGLKNVKGGRWMDLIKIGKYIAGKRKSLGDDTKATGRKIRYE